MFLHLALAAFAADPVPTVSLRYGWTAGRSWEVTLDRVEDRVVHGTGALHQEAHAAWVATAEPRDGGVVLRVTDYRSTLAPDPRSQPYYRAMATAGVAVPDWVIDRNGKLVGVEGGDRARAGVMKEVDALVGLGPVPRAQLLDFVSDAQLQAAAAEAWNMHVGMWAGADLAAGEVYTMTAPTPIPALGTTVTLRTESRYEGRVPCDVADTQNRCVKLATRSWLDDQEIKEAMAKLVGNLAAPGTGPAPITGLEMTTDITLVTEAATLEPHQVVMRRDTKMTMTENGAAVESGGTETRTWTWKAR